MISRILRGLAPVVALALGSMAAGCDAVNVQIGETEAVPLAELDQSGPAPDQIVLAGPDRIVLTEGDTLKIDVSGDPEAVEALRFTLDDGALGIMRKKGNWSSDKGTATVRVTMPAPKTITLAGSGTIEAPALAAKSEVVIAGSGSARVAKARTDRIEITIAGSGTFSAAGEADVLEMTIAGSGSADMAGLKVASAELTIAGSGDAEFSSDGKVEASIVGSGSVTVLGRADCTISSMGSGTLNCREGTVAAKGKGGAPKPPEPPKAPGAPAAPEAGLAPDAPTPTE